MKRWLPNFSFRFDAPKLRIPKLKQAAAATVLLLAGWWLGILLFFPAAILEQRLEDSLNAALSGQGRLDLEQLSPGFIPGVSFNRITWNPPQASLPPLSVIEIGLKPLWWSLLSGNPGVAFDAELLGGEVDGFVRRNGELGLDLHDQRFVFPLMPNSSLAVAGTLEQGELATLWPPVEKSASRLDLRLKELRVTGLQALGSAQNELNLGSLVLQATGIGNAVKIDRLETADGSVIVTGSGNLLLSAPLEQSRLNLTIRLTPTPELDSSLKDLLGLLTVPEQNGSYLLNLSGTFSRIRTK